MQRATRQRALLLFELRSRSAFTSCRGYATETSLPREYTGSEPSPKRQKLDHAPNASASGTQSTSHGPVLNRTGAIEPALHRELAGIVNHFRAPIRHAFAYGSGVFRQTGYQADAKPMIDFIFAVSEPVQWHSLNLQQNRHHYANLAKVLGASIISHIQESYGAKAWFNVECEVNGRLIKYGVISIKALCDDLSDWDTLYMSGRMQKPIHILRDEPRVRINEEVNLKNAFRTALLLLPERFTEEDLFRRITSLSYQGDFRMRIGENPGKVSNIVSAQFERFQVLYAPFLSAKSPSTSRQSIIERASPTSSAILQDMSPRARGALARKLPERLREKVFALYERTENVRIALGQRQPEELTETDEATLWTHISQTPKFQENLSKSLEAIVAGPAFYQSLKGIVSVGPAKGLRYVWPKIQKRWQGR